MSVCIFFGHSECCGLDAVLRCAIEELIKQGTTESLVGNYGQFAGMAKNRGQQVINLGSAAID